MARRRRAPPRKRAAPRRRSVYRGASRRSGKKSIFWGEIIGLAGMAKAANVNYKTAKDSGVSFSNSFVYAFTGINLEAADPIKDWKEQNWKVAFSTFAPVVIGEGLHRTVGKKMNSKLPWYLRV